MVGDDLGFIVPWIEILGRGLGEEGQVQHRPRIAVALLEAQSQEYLHEGPAPQLLYLLLGEPEEPTGVVSQAVQPPLHPRPPHVSGLGLPAQHRGEGASERSIVLTFGNGWRLLTRCPRIQQEEERLPEPLLARSAALQEMPQHPVHLSLREAAPEEAL